MRSGRQSSPESRPATGSQGEVDPDVLHQITVNRDSVSRDFRRRVSRPLRGVGEHHCHADDHSASVSWDGDLPRAKQASIFDLRCDYGFHLWIYRIDSAAWIIAVAGYEPRLVRYLVFRTTGQLDGHCVRVLAVYRCTGSGLFSDRGNDDRVQVVSAGRPLCGCAFSGGRCRISWLLRREATRSRREGEGSLV
jgi:hypothetical protein